MNGRLTIAALTSVSSCSYLHESERTTSLQGHRGGKAAPVGGMKAIPEASLARVNVPSATVGDAQVNAEYIAYAINYLSALSGTTRRIGGDSAFVPTTIVYSSYDQVVQPLNGKQASGILQSSRIADVSNNHLQTLCHDRPGGGFYTQEGVLYSSLTWALVVVMRFGMVARETHLGSISRRSASNGSHLNWI
ncbi:putative lipase [Aspergillus saccharolyticus JOP 1030-1]|uniref:Uncharacterized protein n=1 Tax=Aspergillus saccharolyticus JOP 1030-1 TaxID=1450539 RepID=A0A318ZAS1_9EURO|nr:hypothetical protein BP01DRAFT_384618 [Aspergillus saccharolyticus JOP 1030-1]PYH43424.1 hypothetical protein BP01DRAFT_384618 [Aspergillus saccharolyticus JOP 1030-1]